MKNSSKAPGETFEEFPTYISLPPPLVRTDVFHLPTFSIADKSKIRNPKSATPVLHYSITPILASSLCFLPPDST
jgi:hypothetical protein